MPTRDELELEHISRISGLAAANPDYADSSITPDRFILNNPLADAIDGHFGLSAEGNLTVRNPDSNITLPVVFFKDNFILENLDTIVENQTLTVSFKDALNGDQDAGILSALNTELRAALITIATDYQTKKATDSDLTVEEYFSNITLNDLASRADNDLGDALSTFLFYSSGTFAPEIVTTTTGTPTSGYQDVETLNIEGSFAFYDVTELTVPTPQIPPTQQEVPEPETDTPCPSGILAGQFPVFLWGDNLKYLQDLGFDGNTDIAVVFDAIQNSGTDAANKLGANLMVHWNVTDLDDAIRLTEVQALLNNEAVTAENIRREAAGYQQIEFYNQTFHSTGQELLEGGGFAAVTDNRGLRNNETRANILLDIEYADIELDRPCDPGQGRADIPTINPDTAVNAR